MSEKKAEHELVEIYRAFNLADADLRKAVLEAAGIDVMVKDGLATMSMEGQGIATGGVKLLVRAEDVLTAREILDPPGR